MTVEEIKPPISNHFINILLVVIFTVIAVCLFAHIMTTPLSHDENMYVTAGVLSIDNTLYDDFAYLQMPYLPAIYKNVFALTGTSHYLLWGRITTFLFSFILLIILYRVTFSIAKDKLVSLSAVLLLLISKSFLVSSGYAWNNPASMMFGLLAYYMFSKGINPKLRPLFMFISGICLSVAIGIKLFYVLLIIPFLVFPFFRSKEYDLKSRILNILLPFSGGMLYGIFPALLYLFRNCDCFLFYNLFSHRMVGSWKTLQGVTFNMDFFSKLTYSRKILNFPSNLLVITGIIFIVLTLKRLNKGKKAENSFAVENIFLSLLILGFGFITIFQPTPLLLQYCALPAPYALILLVSLFACINSEKTRQILKIVVVLFTLVSVCFQGDGLLAKTRSLSYPLSWTPLQVHNTALLIKEEVSKGKIATLAPLYAIESGLGIYKEFSSGSFLFRIAEFIPEKKLWKYHAVTGKCFKGLFRSDYPDAILVGFEGDIEKPLEDYALEKRYILSGADLNGMKLFIKKEQ